jgi:hypothetical protein
LAKAPHQVERDGPRLQPRFEEGDASLVSTAPDHLGPIGPLVLVHRQVEFLRHGEGFAEHQLGALRRDVADEAIHHRHPPVESDLAAEIGARPRGFPPVLHGAGSSFEEI